MDIWPQEDTPQYTYSEAFRNMARELEVTKAACRILEQERDDLAAKLGEAIAEARVAGNHRAAACDVCADGGGDAAK